MIQLVNDGTGSILVLLLVLLMQFLFTLFTIFFKSIYSSIHLFHLANSWHKIQFQCYHDLPHSIQKLKLENANLSFNFLKYIIVLSSLQCFSVSKTEAAILEREQIEMV